MRGRKVFLYTLVGVVAAAVVVVAALQYISSARLKQGDSELSSDPSRSERFVFNADTAYYYCAQQCAFGPRTMNSEAHERCGEWLKETFASFGLAVESQRTTLTAYDGTALKAENIIARWNVNKRRRLLFCAHWDSRPWADNDPNPENHHSPVLAANDGASGVAVLLALAQMLAADSVGVDIGVDFVCFDAEDYGIPQWAESEYTASNTWALGSRYWAEQYAENGGDGGEYLFGILLDMVGGEGARFYKEGMSTHFAPTEVERVWSAAQRAGFSEFFPKAEGSYVTDDHISINEIALIPCIDIIAYYPDCPQSSFGPTWHTVSDTMEHISLSTLRAVGQTLARLLSDY